jgi:elongation factor P
MTVATQIKRGNVIVLNNDLYRIIRLEHITPGKGNAIVHADLRSIRTGVKTNRRYRSSEDIETVEVYNRRMQYLYSDGDIFHFMDQENFEQYEIAKDMLDETIYYILPDHTYDVMVYENNPIGIELPPTVTMKITETSPAEKGTQGKTKDAILETGLKVRIPLFFEEGEEIVINTETNGYLERAKK